MIKKSILVICNTLFSLFIPIFAQENEEIIPLYKTINQLTIKKSYQISVRPSYFIPMPGTSSYISNGGSKPLSISFDIVQPQKYSIGIEISHQYFQEYKPRAVYEYDGTLISTAQMRTLANTPILFNYTQYVTTIDQTFRPYLQMGAGITHVNYNNYWGYIEDPKKRWAPTASPALGFKLNIDKKSNWLIDSKLKYIIAPFKYDFINKLNYLAVDVSLGYRWWKD